MENIIDWIEANIHTQEDYDALPQATRDLYEKAKEAEIRYQESAMKNQKLMEEIELTKAALEAKQVEMEEQRRVAAHTQLLYSELEQQLQAANAKLAQQLWKKREEGRKARVQHVKAIDRKKIPHDEPNVE